VRLFVLGASGSVGSILLREATLRGHSITAQTRSADKLVKTAAVNVVVGSPTDRSFLSRHMDGHDAVILCVGIDSIGGTTLFSETAKAVVTAMQASDVRRLVAITGIGAGETRGHGGWLYNWIIYPLFTRNRYADKDRQEMIIEAADLDWTIVRPAPFAKRTGVGPLQVFTEIPNGLQLRSITRAEVADFILESVETGTFIRQKPFIGHS